MQATAQPRGTLTANVTRAHAPLLWRVRNALRPSFLRGWFAYHVVAPIANKFGVMTVMGTLSALQRHADGTVTRYGVIDYRVVTDVFAEDVVDELQANQAAFSNYRFHAAGTSATAPAVGDTALGTEVETRATGTQTENTSKVYRSVGTVSFTATRSIVEHGLFDASSTGTLLDRSTFTSIGVNNGDSIQFTYDLTVASGG